MARHHGANQGNMKMSRKLTVVFTALVAVFLMSPIALAADADQYQAVLEKAELKRQTAAEKIQLWNTTKTLLDSAANAAEGGHYEHAIELVKEAELHIDLALATAEREKTTWQRNVPK